MPLTATPMIRAAPRVDQMPRSRRVAHRAAVDATIAMITESTSSAGLYVIRAGARMAAMPE
jgi:hypothetical protein